MDANQWIALALLFGRGYTVWNIVQVIRHQWAIRKIADEYADLRKRMFILSFTVLVGNFIPILIDVFGLFGLGSFELLLAYVFSNNITAMILSFMLKKIYLSGNRDER